MEPTDEQLRDLVVLGKIELGNGEVVWFTEEPDEWGSLNDFDCYGRVEQILRGRRQSERPDDFDGMAEKIWTQYECYWWQPPSDLRSGWHNYEHRNHLRDLVRDILDYGFVVYRVEWCRGECVHGDPIVVDFATIGGVEPFADNDTKAMYVADLVAELSDTCVGVA